MHALAGPYLASAVLLVVAGSGKLVDPLPLVRALRSVRLPAGATVVRALAGVEIAVGVVAVVTGARAAAVLVALSYSAFTVFVLRARSVGGVLASCGCFGRSDTPPTAVHVAVTAAFAVTAALVAVRPLGRLDDVLAAGPWAGAPLVLATAAVAALSYLVLALLPPLLTALQPPPRTAR